MYWNGNTTATNGTLNETMYSRMDQVKFVEDSLQKIWSDIVCLGRPYHFKVFKDCLPHVSLGPFFNTLTQISCKE